MDATAADYAQCFGVPPTASMRLWKVVEDDKLLAIFGWYYTGGNAAVLCCINGTFPAKKIFRVAKRCMKKLEEARLPFVAQAHPGWETAPRFLAHLGFQHLETNSTGAIYGWPQQSHS